MILRTFAAGLIGILTVQGTAGSARAADWSIAVTERTQVTEALDEDTQLGVEIAELWESQEDGRFGDLGVAVHERRVLVYGMVPDDASRDQAIRLAWSPDNVDEVIDEIRIGETGLVDLARDRLITAKLQAKLKLDRDVTSGNYVVKTSNRVIYLLGVARSKAEHAIVKRLASDIANVRNVISYVLVKRDPPS